MRVITSLCCAVALAILLVPGARADENDRLTYMTFSGPVQVPGVTLAAGTYTFKIADGAVSRHVVQIFNKDDNKLITTVLTIPNERLEPVKDTFVMFQERPAGVPVAVKAWFYPGRSIGEEFLYPKQQAMAIARSSGESVLSTEGDITDQSARIGRVNERGESADSSTTTTTTTTTATTTTAPAATTTTAPANRVSEATTETTTTAKASTATTTTTAPAAAAAAAPLREPSTTANVVPVAPIPEAAPAPAPQATVGTSGQVPTPAPAERRLPRTASPLALLELLSGLSVAGGLGLRQLRKHV